MHNMIIEDSVKSTKNNMSTTLINEGHYVLWWYGNMGLRVTISHSATPELDAWMQNYKNIKDNEIHYQLKADLIEHLWQNHSKLYNID
jgi:hypothetical protein